LLAVLAGLFARGYAASWQDELVLLLPLGAVLVLVSSQTGLNHHLRYVLPVFPLAFVWMSKVARAVDLKHGKVVLIVAVSLVWSVSSSLWVYPHSLSYFNELAGGPRNGHAHLLGSNLDWGQDLLYLKGWLDNRPEALPVGLALSCYYDPRIVGIEFTRPPVGPGASGWPAGRSADPSGPHPGWYAISVNEVRRRTKEYLYFFSYQPVATAGYSIHVYHIGLDEANRVRRELGLRELPGDLAAGTTGKGGERGQALARPAGGRKPTSGRPDRAAGGATE
jgi:hypothetical protein